MTYNRKKTLKWVVLISSAALIGIVCETAQAEGAYPKNSPCWEGCSKPGCKDPCEACCKKKWFKPESKGRQERCLKLCEKHKKNNFQKSK